MRNLALKLTLWLAILSPLALFAQIEVEQIRKFTAQQKYFTEKIYVHTDKPQYFAGELIWFKIYNLSNLGGGLSNLSKVAYIELIDQNNQAQLQAMVELDAGTGDGSFKLPKIFATGSYTLRCYTNMMKNAGVDVFFEKKIAVLNPNSLKASSSDNLPYNIEFFPEGGDLIEGIDANVAFKAIDNNGKGITIKGVIVDDKNDTLATINTFKYGIGKFRLAPKPGRIYKAICITPDKKVLIKALPLFKKEGYALTLNTLDGMIEVLTHSTQKNAQVILVVHNGKKVVETQSKMSVDGNVNFAIDKSNLEAGIYHLTLFNGNGQPVAERLFYHKTTKKLHFSAAPLKANYGSREKVTVIASSVDEKSFAKSANASFSMYKIDSLQKLDEVDIISYLELTAEVKGTIENPSYYFSNNNEETTQALDYLLLTQGWRRFDWNKRMPVVKELSYLPEYNGHLVRGTAFSENNKPLSNLRVYLSSPKKDGVFYHTLTDSVGEFLFNTHKLYGVNELILQTDYTKDSTSRLSIKRPYDDRQRKLNFALHNETFTKEKQLITEYFFATQVQGIYADEFLSRFYQPPTTSNFYGKPFKSYTLSDYTSFSTLEEVLREYVSNIFVSKRQKNFNLRVVGGNQLLKNNPLVLYDGVPYFDLNKMMSVSPEDIEKIDIVREKYYYYGATYDGIVQFHSKKATLSDYALNPNAIVIDYEGMQVQREFYKPKYDSTDQMNKHLPDYRNMLHWEPNLSFDDKGEVQFSFYTSDLGGKFIGIIQGVAKDGTLAKATFEIEVKK